MIESENLRTASLYINNQLLSRGLLRDGHSIDFSHPGETDGEVADTMSRIMSVVNDLILRRDVSTWTHTVSCRYAGVFNRNIIQAVRANHWPKHSAMPSTANHCQLPSAPCAPNRCGKQTTSSVCKKRTPRLTAKSD